MSAVILPVSGKQTLNEKPAGQVLLRDEARRLAEQVRKNFWGELLPVCAETVARRLGIKVAVTNLYGTALGVIVKKVGQEPQIFVEKDATCAFQNFICAHEIGHYLERTMLLTIPDDDYGFVDRRFGETDIHEFFATVFAYHLLMPAEVLCRSDDTVSAAAQFNVPVHAVRDWHHSVKR